MSIKESTLNDLMTQCSSKLIKRTKEEEQKRKEEINNCDHLFVKLREVEQPYNTILDSLTVECVHCGVTNKFKDLESTMLRYRKTLEYYVITRFHYFNVEYNNITIESEMMKNISKKEIENKLMSDRIIRSFHPGLLYNIARFIKPEGDNEELMDIMIKLNNIETTEEKNKLNTIFDAKELIERYFDSKEEKEKVFIK